MFDREPPENGIAQVLADNLARSSAASGSLCFRGAGASRGCSTTGRPSWC